MRRRWHGPTWLTNDRRSGHRRRQRRAVRGADGARGRRRVLLLEAAPREWRGGNSQHTRNLRCMHDAPQDVLTDAYPEEEFWQDLLQGHRRARPTRRWRGWRSAHSASCRDWMRRHGVRFQPSLSGTLHLSRTNAFFLGGGKALVNAYYRSAEALGVQVRYDARSTGSNSTDGRFVAAWRRRRAHRGAGLRGRRGGFESNLEWLREAWGRNERGEWPADNFLIRGTRFNPGVLLKDLLDAGADADRRSDAGAHGGHRRPRAAVRRRHLHAGRLRLAGHRRQPRRRALLRRGRGLLAQALRDLGPAGRRSSRGRSAYSIIDAKAVGRFMPPVFRRRAGRHRWPNWRGSSGCRRSGVRAHRAARSTRPAAAARFDHAVLDDCRTEGLAPPKTHWARPIDTPPFFGYALRPGITFTYLGLKVDEQAARALRRRAQRQPVRGRRDDGRQRARPGLHRRRRHDHRHRVRAHRRRTAALRGDAALARADADREAERPRPRSRVLQICNACRYCEGYLRGVSGDGAAARVRRRPTCTTWPTCATTAARACTPASTRRRTSSPSTCRARWPGARAQTYAEYAWPRGARRAVPAQRPDAGAGAGGRPGAVPGAAAGAPGRAVARAAGRRLLRRVPARPDGRRCSAPVFGFAVLALAIGAPLLARDRAGRRTGEPRAARARRRATRLRLQLPRRRPRRGLQRRRRRASRLWRRRFHHLTFYGFVLCFAATCVATLYHYVLG